MITEKSSKRYFAGAGIAGLALFLFLNGTGVLNVQSTYANGQTSAAVNPFFQLPGGSVVVTAEGLAPNADATIFIKNVVARVETQEAGESATVTFPDQIVIGETQTTSSGTLEWALGVPKDDVTVIERWINNSTEQVIKTVTTTYRFQGTVKVIVVDEFGNSADAELIIIRWIPESPF